jgi:hypothetical protein
MDALGLRRVLSFNGTAFLCYTRSNSTQKSCDLIFDDERPWLPCPNCLCQEPL